MAITLDRIDVTLLRELQTDAGRPNVELAKQVGLSPAATLNRVRRLRDAGILGPARARVDANAAGFPLLVYVLATLAEHDEAAHRRFKAAVDKIPNVVSADWVTGETDALLQVVARDVDELQRVLLLLSSRAGAQRLVTLLRLEELKPAAPLPVAPASLSERAAAREGA
ncbi:MAG TPA: Lrp/AsnC family transcriptional regulator [Thermoleophilaceae bacterium]